MVVSRAVIDKINLITGDDTAHKGKRHHASDKGGEKFLRASLYGCRFISTAGYQQKRNAGGAGISSLEPWWLRITMFV